MSPAPIQLLLADDDADDRTLFLEALGELPLSTSFNSVQDGEQLMQLLTEEATKLPDVLFLDLNMPRKNGFECLAEIKANQKLKELPVIIFSTSFDDKIVKELHTNGANYYIRKPNEFIKLKEVIQRVLSAVTPPPPPPKPSLENFVVLP